MFYLYRSLRRLLALPLAAVGIFPHACRLEPTCSRYCDTALVRYGLFKGSLLCLKRVLRCRPGGPVGFDPVP